MRIPISVRIKSIFARDKDAFWWDHFTDEEKQLRRMDAFELAKVIHAVNVHQDNPEKKIVAEHLLNVRLAKIQATASWGSGVIGFVGAIIGAAISVALTAELQGQKEAPCTVERASEKQTVDAPVKEARKPVAPPLKKLEQ